MSDPYAPEGRGRPADAPTHDFGSAGWDTASDAMDQVDVTATSQTSSLGGSESGATTASSGTSGSGGTTSAAKEQGQQLAGQAADSGKHVAGVAKDEAKSVVGEAGAQARGLLGQAQSQLSSQASTQKSSLVEWLRSLAEELGSMANTSRQGAADESSRTSGVTAQLTQRAQDYAHDTASWLDNHEPSQIFDEVGRFARRRPGVFLAIAAAAGVVAGRLTRGLTAGSDDDQSSGQAYGRLSYSGQGYDRDVTAPDLSTTGYAGTGGYAGGTGYSTGTGTGYSTGTGYTEGTGYSSDTGYTSGTGYTGDTGYASDTGYPGSGTGADDLTGDTSTTYPTTGGVSSGPYGEEGR